MSERNDRKLALKISKLLLLSETSPFLASKRSSHERSWTMGMERGLQIVWPLTIIDDNLHRY